MLSKNNGSIKIFIQGNKPESLNNPHTLWKVISGEVLVFVSKINNGEPAGKRRYLFSVKAGEAIFGTLLTEQLCLVAIAIQEAQLQSLSLEELAEEIEQKKPEAILLLEKWLEQIGNITSIVSLSFHFNSALPSSLSLAPEQILQGDSSQLTWIKVERGNISWLGIKDLLLNNSSPLFPFAPGMWFKAEDEAEIELIQTTEINWGVNLLDSLALCHQYLLAYLTISELQENEKALRKFQIREQLNRQANESAMTQLASVLKPQKNLSLEADPLQETTPLLMAVGAVARVSKISIKLPPLNSYEQTENNLLEAIAHASQFRIRQVSLTDGWWRQKYGALLAYIKEDNCPVALLPTNNNQSKYILFNPTQKTYFFVNKKLANTLKIEAYIFYPSLPISVKNALDLLSFAIKNHEQDIILLITIGIIATIIGMIPSYGIGLLVDDAIPDSDRLLLWQVGLGLLIAALGQSIFQLSQGIIAIRIENVTDSNLQLAIWDKLLKLTPAFFRQYPSGDIVDRLLAVRRIRSRLSGATQRTLLSGLFSLLNLALMAVYSVQLTLVGLGITLLNIIITVFSSVILLGSEQHLEKLNGEIYGLTIQLIKGVAKLRVAAAEERAFSVWAEKYSRRIKLQTNIQKINDDLSTLNRGLPLIGSIILFWLTVFIMKSELTQENLNSLTTGTFLAFSNAFIIFLNGVIDLSNTLTDIIGIKILWKRVDSIIQAPTEFDLKRSSTVSLRGNISLNDISFRYQEDGQLILKDVNIQAKPGEFIAIVGPSGGGKSTILRLLLGFESPNSGSVYYDGQDLARLDLVSLRRQIGTVLQGGQLQRGSIYDNITGGAIISLKEAWEAAKMAGLDEDIQQMPMGMHTEISEGGSNLSGGQRQRLLIARALVNHPTIVLMDEATSALDNRTQAIVTQNLENLKATRIIIAHRLSTIRHADRIYVIDSGRIVQVGTFDELISQEGLFTKLVARQLL